MESIHGIGEQAELLKVVRGVRTRWKLKHALRGLGIALAGTFVVYAITAMVVHSLNYSEMSVMAGRVVCVVAFIAFVIQFVVRPTLPNIQDERAALYLEEHEPSVDGAIFTSIEVDNALKGGNQQISPALAGRLKSNAIERARIIGDGRRVDAVGLRNSWALIAAVIVAATIITRLGPAPLRNGLRLLAMPWKTTEASTIFSIAVDPGNMKVAKGGDAEVGARLRNFQSEEVVVLMRGADSASWVRVPMTTDSTGHYTARLLDISVATEYLIEANGIRSSAYRIDVVNLPFVKNMNMEYRYPGYTGMSPEKFDSTGDIAALKGTLVTLKVEPTMPTEGGQVVLDNGEKLKLTPNQDGTLSATIRVDHTGFYKVELAGPDGSMVTGSLDYTIDMLVDRKPTVIFKKPGRDSKVMAVDEVYTEAEAKDDYGVSKLELVYSVNGDKERTVPLSQATSRVLKEIAAGYTFMLEDYQLQPGDVVSYFARAIDNDAVSGAKSATTDIYFLNVAPYSRDYRQGQGGGGGGGGGGQQDNPGQFSQRQRDIIAATFKSSRDSSYSLPKTLSEDVQTIRLSQQKLREDVEGLAQRLVQRGITASDTNYAKVAKLLTKAGAIMDTAEKTLGDKKLTDARGPEQRALQQLAQAEAVFRDITVQQQQQQQGGGGGQPQGEAQDLADLFELKQERLRNQYEEVNRGQAEQQEQQQQQQQAIDSVAQKLKELAQRQQTEDERARAKADSMNAGRPQQQGGGGGGGAQRQSAQQAEEAARQLERLARERQSQNLADAARALQNAADEMKRGGATGQSGAMSPEAQRQLEEARRLMDRERQMSDQKNVGDAINQARQLQAEQQRVNSDVNRLGTADSAQARKDIAQRSGQMADRMRDLQDQMERIARNVQGEQPNTARDLRSAADSARASRIENQMRAAQQMADRGMSSNYLRDVTEPQISRGIDNLNRQLDRAQAAANSAQNQQAGAQSLDKVRDMVNGVESLAERVQQQVDQANARRLTGGNGQQQQQNGQQQNGQQQNGQQNGQQQNGKQQSGQQQSGQQQQQNGQQGQQGQQGQGQQGQGQQGQQGQGQQGQGQQGQQGQGQQGQGQGQQGQQGQGQGQQGQPNQQGGGGNQGGSQNQGRPGQMGGNQNQSSGNPSGGQNMDPQLQRELAQRLADAEALRRELQRQGRDVSQLDQAIQGLQGATNLRSLSDERASKLLQTQVDALKNFEFQLARAINGQKEGVRVGRTGDVPPAYRALVDEYYREIGKTPGAKKPPL